LTALAVIVSGAWTEGTSTEMTANAFNLALPQFGGIIVAASSLLFGYSSLIAVTYYGEIAFSYLWGIRIKIPYRWIFCGIILVGAGLKVEVAWSIGDFFNGMMTLTNLIGVLGLTGVAITAIKSYLKELDQKRRGQI
jgi:AGCS family alanine or glycine:cation symporter